MCCGRTLENQLRTVWCPKNIFSLVVSEVGSYRVPFRCRSRGISLGRYQYLRFRDERKRENHADEGRLHWNLLRASPAVYPLSSPACRIITAEKNQLLIFIVSQALRDSSATEDIAACNILQSGGTLKDGCIQCLSHPSGALPSSPCLFPASGTETALRIFLFALTPQLAHSSFPVMNPAPCPTQLWSKKLLLLTASLSFSEGSWWWESRNPITSQLTGVPSARGGVYSVVKEMPGLQDAAAGPRRSVLCCLSGALSTYFRFPSLNSNGHKKNTVKQH